MKKYKTIIRIIFMLGFTMLIYNKSVFAILPKISNYYTSVSYGIAIFLMIWQWLQYIIPFLITIIIFIINRKKLNSKKIITFLLLGLLTFLVFYHIGTIIVNNSHYNSYSSTTLDMFKYNGKIVYYHK